MALVNDYATPQVMDVLNALDQRLLALPLEALPTHRNDLSELLPGVYFLRSTTGTTRLMRQQGRRWTYYDQCATHVTFWRTLFRTK